MTQFVLETIHRIHDDKTQDYLEIGPDAEGGDHVELRTYSYNHLTNKWDIGQRIAIHPDSIDLLIQVLEKNKKV